MGPSGSGKTTLLSLVGCLDKPSGGKVIIDGVDVTDIRESSLYRIRRGKIGFIFQTFNLIESLNAVENVELPMENTIKSRVERKEKALKLLALVGLKDRGQHRPTQLSAGEQQRVAIARALANDPAIILADEPTGSLDSETGLNIVKMLRRLSSDKKCLVLMVTHDNLMASLASRTISMRDGKLAS
jgi:putative ABC transport system ATP-binding protein